MIENTSRKQNNSIDVPFILLTAVTCVLVLFGSHSSIFSLIAFLISILVICKYEITYTLAFMMVLMPFAGMFKFSPTGTSFFTYLELLFVLLSFFRRGFKLYGSEASISLFALFLISTQLIFTGSVLVTNTIKIISHLLLIVYVTRVEIEDTTPVYFGYILGFIAASLCSRITSSFFNLSLYTELKTQRIGNDVVTRFSGFYGDPNYYGVNLIICLCLLLILYRKKKISLIPTAIIASVLIVFAGMTASKSVYLVLIIPFVIFVITLFQDRKFLPAVCFTILGVFAVILVFRGGIFDSVTNRIINAGNDLNELTTGRYVIWINYLDHIKSSFLSARFLLGNSIANILLDNRAAHNTYIDMLYQLGVFGTIWILSIIIIAFKRGKKSIHRVQLNYSVLIVIAILYFALSELQYYDMPYHLILAFLTINDSIDESICAKADAI